MSNWKNALYWAVLNNDFSKFTSILSLDEVKSELSIVKEWEPFEDPIHQAAFNGRCFMLMKLLENGADPNAYLVHDNGDKILPIHWAVFNTKLSSVELLTQFGADEELEGEYYGRFSVIIKVKLWRFFFCFIQMPSLTLFCLFKIAYSL